MKKSIIIAAIVLLGVFSVNAQFLYSLGLSLGASYGKEHWSNEQPGTQEKYIPGLNVAAFAEFFKGPYVQWRSEFLYNQLGTKEVVMGNSYTNHTNYVSFDNYLKINVPQYNFVPYFLIGPRIEYLVTRDAAVFTDVIDRMPSVHISAAAGIGVSKICFTHVKPFIEFFYNRDITPSFNGHSLYSGFPETIYSYNFELRIGLKYVFKAKEKCPHVDNSAGNPEGAH